MDELDRAFVKGMRPRGDEDKNIYNLLGIIDHLEAQLTEIKEAAEPFTDLATKMDIDTLNDISFPFINTDGKVERSSLLEIDFRRLAEALKEVKDE